MTKTMNKSTLQDAVSCFERFEIDAELYSDNTVLVQTINPDVYVEISKQEIIWRADQHLELLKQEQES